MENKQVASPRAKNDNNSPEFRPKTRGKKRKRAISDSSTDDVHPEKSHEVEKKGITNAKLYKKDTEANTPRKIQNDSDNGNSPKSRSNTCRKRRKRVISDSSSDMDDVLPENTLEVEKNLIASAVKNNLDEASVKKILKKVVTNDHVLALVKLQEEEEQARETQEGGHAPKLTRSKVKELKKASSSKAPWDLGNLELTPIKHIPVKTRPEVTALIAHELPDDEDDDEYEPAHHDLPSDDDQTLESCSDADSQPRTPATPAPAHSPRVVKDGPFKVPQALTPARRKLDLDKEEEATIALRTRSKLCLSETPIEHIESSFIPPDDIPVQVDDLWSQFLAECLDPARAARLEDDDDADPEYNVAADPDAHDEDEEALENSIIKISKKELNDLVTELFNIMPEDDLAGNIPGVVAETQPTTRWEGKQEPLSDEETAETTIISSRRISDRITFERRDSTAFSIGKIEPPDDEDQPQYLEIGAMQPKTYEVPIESAAKKEGIASKVDRLIQDTISLPVENPTRPFIANMVKVVDGEATKMMNIMVGRETVAVPVPSAPLPLQKVAIGAGNRGLVARPKSKVTRVQVPVNSKQCILPEQVIIVQQQLRQHVQLAASNFMQLFVHPLNYGFGPTYKGFIESLVKIADKTPNSIADVCNLRPAMQLITDWEKKVSEDTPENTEYIQFIQDDCAKWARYLAKKNYYNGEFHPMFKKAVAESPVFMYPYLLPPRPYQNRQRRHAYLVSEDELITLGLDQFWQYVVDNPKLYPPPKTEHPRQRWWLNATLELISRHMLPFLSVKILLSHIATIRKQQGMENPINRFLATHEVRPVEHRVLPYNSRMTLHDQPVEEMPRLWLRYLAKVQPRFRKYVMRHKNHAGAPPIGIPVHINLDPEAPVVKAPLPLDFTKVITTNRKKKKAVTATPSTTNAQTSENVVTNITINPSSSVYKIEGTGEIAKVVPLIIQVNAAENSTIPTNNIAVIDLTEKPVSSSNSSNAPIKTIDCNLKSSTTTLTTNCNNSPITSTRSIPNDSITPNRSIPNDSTTHNMSIANDCITPKRSILNDSITSNKSIPNDSKTPNRSIPNGSTTPNRSMPNDSISPNTNSDSIGLTQPGSNRPDHCECCMLLRKVCKRQTKITEYFKEKTKKPCYCKDVEIPRITKKLIHLVNSFKDPYRIAMDHLLMKLEEAKEQAKILLSYVRKRQNKVMEAKKYEIEESRTTDAEDLSYVIGYKMKLMARLGPSVPLKSKVHSIFSTFNIASDDPMVLARSLSEVLTGHHAALFRDFLPFLTKEQAARMGMFKDYFALVCVADLVNMVEEEIVLSECRRAMLHKLHRALTNSADAPGACQLCVSLLPAFYNYPHLAQRVFRLFPHTLFTEEDTSVENNVFGRRRCREAKKRPRDKHKVEVAVSSDVTAQAPVVSEADNACRAETTTAMRASPAKPEYEKRLMEVSQDTSQANVDPETNNSRDSSNTTQEDMDITFCSDSTVITTPPKVTRNNSTQNNAVDSIQPMLIVTNSGDSTQNAAMDTCGDSTQNDAVDTCDDLTQKKDIDTNAGDWSQNAAGDTCGDSTQNTINDTVNGSPRNEIDETINSKSITADVAASSMSQDKTGGAVLDASKDRGDSRSDLSQDRGEERGGTSQNVADVTLCGDTQTQADVTLTKDNSQMQVDYEADHSSSGEEESPSDMDTECEIKEEAVDPNEDGYGSDSNIQIIMCDIKSELCLDGITEINPQTVKQEDQDSDTERSLVIDSDEERIKSETTEWLREEDKLILQVIKDNISKEQRGDKPILEFIEDKQVIHLLSESLTHKSVNEIKDRIIYLLQMLLLSD